MAQTIKAGTLEDLSGAKFVRLAQGGRERNWWIVRAQDERYVVLTRQAPFKPSGTSEYTIIDRERGVRGPCDLIGGGWDVDEPGGCDELLRALQAHDEQRETMDRESKMGVKSWSFDQIAVEVSYRNNVPIAVIEVAR